MEKSCLEMESLCQEAIKVEGACKMYKDSCGKGVAVLNSLDIQVPRGKIYGLLGPSGCGKTTLLKVMLGKIGLDSGSVSVFGQTPGDRTTGVPGRRVGYMPQELALFGEFNIAETLEYFSRIFGMSRKRFEERLEFLMKFLDLPSQTRPLEKMSGGQQRRASLAVALLHEPDLLVLDEPTVGVDPLLRQSIWEHLIDLSSSNQSQATTIIITTHYTEEAMQAHTVGMMRSGHLLTEGPPRELLSIYNKVSLEEVFMDLCLQDQEVLGQEVEEVEKEGVMRVITEKKEILTKDIAGLQNGCLLPKSDMPDIKMENEKEGKLVKCGGKDRFSFSNLWACMRKTFNRIRKRWGFMVYTFLLPALQMSLFCLAIGQDPRDLSMAVVTDEVDTEGGQCEHNNRCPLDIGLLGLSPNSDMANISCRYLGFLNTNMIKPVFFNKEEDAVSAVSNGDAWGVIHMGSNFSEALYQKLFNSFTCLDPDQCQTTTEASRIKVKLDVTNQQLAFTLQLQLVEAFQDFLGQIVSSCNFPPDVASLPLVFDTPIYGHSELTFTDFMAPGIILTIVHSMALGFSAMVVIIERNEGLLDRTWVAGVSTSEITLANFLCSFLVNLVQVLITLGFMLAAFQLEVHGSYLLVLLLTLLQGMSGTTIGLLISSVCRTQQDATQIALGIFYPNMILSGILWPLEAMPRVLRYIAYILPQTLACEAMRSILMRGWGLEHPVVLMGFGVTLAWVLVVYFLFKLMMHKTR